MTAALAPTPAPNLELALAKLANDAMANGADPHDTTQKLHATLSYLRKFPKVAQQATNALADGVASPAEITRTLWPHASALTHASGPNAPTDEEAANLPLQPEGSHGAENARFGGGLASFVSGLPGGEALTTGVHAAVTRQPYADALTDVRAAEEASPISTPLKLAGGSLGLSKVPGSNMAKGAIYGGLMGYTDPDPEADRRGAVIQNAVTGGALGAGADLLSAGASKIGNLAKRQAGKEKEIASALARMFKAQNEPTPAGTPMSAPPSAATGTVIPHRFVAPSRGPLRSSFPPSTPTPNSPVAAPWDRAEAMLTHLRGQQPNEIGNVMGDAELAMRQAKPPAPPIDLEELLRQSIVQGLKP